MTPRLWRGSATRSRLLVEKRIDVVAEPPSVDGGRAVENGDCGLRCHELALSQRRQLSDRHAVASYDERLPAVERAHDLAALVPELALCDLPGHAAIVAHVLHT